MPKNKTYTAHPKEIELEHRGLSRRIQSTRDLQSAIPDRIPDQEPVRDPPGGARGIVSHQKRELAPPKAVGKNETPVPPTDTKNPDSGHNPPGGKRDPQTNDAAWASESGMKSRRKFLPV